MKILHPVFCSLLLLFIVLNVSAQIFTPDLQNAGLWQLVHTTVKNINENDKKAVRFETPGGGIMILKDYEFSEGIIELDIKGQNVFQQSFPGIAIHIQNDTTYDALYFRPFNFSPADTLKRYRAVQYISPPQYDWSYLRNTFPGKYENKVNPVPNAEDWFHAKIVVSGKKIKVYVNNSENPSLEIEKLNDNKTGKLALWDGSGSNSSFANLTITTSANSEKIPYGNNPKTGKYANVGDAKLYYEIYGKGKPIVMLHGGVYGYIDEFEPFIEKLSQNYQVICIGTRGHGKSEMGNLPFTWKQRADDAYKVIRSITQEKVLVLGFSDGGAASLKLAATHPEIVEKLIAIGFGDSPKGSKKGKFNYSPEMLLGQAKELFESRKALMPEPERWGECLSKLNALYNDDYLSKETFSKIKCPTLIMSGEKDEYTTVEKATTASESIKNSQLAIISDCGHVVFYCKFDEVWNKVENFLKNDFKSNNNFWESSDAYLGQTPPADIPQIFAPKILADSGIAFCRVAFSKNGKEFYYTYAKHWFDSRNSGVKQITFDEKKWNKPEILVENLSNPTFSIDESKLFFGGTNSTVWKSERIRNSWSIPVEYLNKNYGLYNFMPTKSGTYYVGSNGNAGNKKDYSTYDFCTLKISRSDTIVQSLGLPLNTSAFDGDFYIASDESYIIVSAKETPTYECELHISFRKKDNTWTPPKSLGSIINNGLAHRFGQYVTPDNKYLFYTQGTSEKDCYIYWVRFDKLLEKMKKESM